MDRPVHVTVDGRGESVSIAIHNEGDPIPLEKQKTIFQSLTCGRESGPEGEGSTNLGLGLFIVHKVVTAHEGTISLASAADTGTTFTVVLPKH